MRPRYPAGRLPCPAAAAAAVAAAAAAAAAAIGTATVAWDRRRRRRRYSPCFRRSKWYSPCLLLLGVHAARRAARAARDGATGHCGAGARAGARARARARARASVARGGGPAASLLRSLLSAEWRRRRTFGRQRGGEAGARQRRPHPRGEEGRAKTAAQRRGSGDEWWAVGRDGGVAGIGGGVDVARPGDDGHGVGEASDSKLQALRASGRCSAPPRCGPPCRGRCAPQHAPSRA